MQWLIILIAFTKVSFATIKNSFMRISSIVSIFLSNYFVIS